MVELESTCLSMKIETWLEALQTHWILSQTTSDELRLGTLGQKGFIHKPPDIFRLRQVGL